jgi:putative nucleotidyltransferase with HDIG domain
MPTLTERFVADIDSLSDLPSLSPVLAHLIATLGREDASVAEVAAIIRQDPVIAARVLRAANSAAYVGRSSVSSIRDALLRLSLARIRRLALMASLYDAVPVRGTQATREIFWQHSLAVAHCSEIIARHAIGAPEDLNPESVFLSGLLHDLGLLVLESHYPKEASAVKRHAEANGMPLSLAELEILETDHGELGALLATHWMMPESITAAIRAHHRFDLAPASYQWNAAAIHLADNLVSQEAIGDLNEGSPVRFSNAAVEALGLIPETVLQITEETRRDAGKSAAALLASPYSGSAKSSVSPSP